MPSNDTLPFLYFVSSNFSTLASFTHTTKISAAIFKSSIVGKDGAIRITESFGSLPYGNGAPAPVKVTPASFAFATIDLAQPSSASKQIK